MRKDNNFVFVTNMQDGACLLFDPKGLGCYPSKKFQDNRLLNALLALPQALKACLIK